VFVRSSNAQRSLVQRAYRPGRGWGPWINLGGSLASDPAVLVDGPRLRVFAAGNAAARPLSQHFYNPSDGWRIVSLGGAVAGRPSVVSYQGYRHVFVRGADGTLRERILRPAGDWSDWVGHGGALAGDPVGHVEGDYLMAFATGTGNTLQQRLYAPDSGWHWVDLAGAIQA
jgi:hypothetical protein